MPYYDRAGDKLPRQDKRSASDEHRATLRDDQNRPTPAGARRTLVTWISRRLRTRPVCPRQKHLDRPTAAALALTVFAYALPIDAMGSATLNAVPSTVRVPEQVRDHAQELCAWTRHRYPPLTTDTSPRQLWIIYRATAQQHRAWGTTPAYLDCGTRKWNTADRTTVDDVRECGYAIGRCKREGTSGFTAQNTSTSGQHRCMAAIALKSGQRTKPGIRNAKATTIHEYVVHCGMQALGNAHRQRIRTFLAERVAPIRLAGWFANEATEHQYRRSAADQMGFAGELELPVVQLAQGKAHTCGPTFKSQAHANAHRWYAEEAFAHLVSAPLAEGAVTGLAAHGPEGTFAARLAMNLNAFAAGLATASDVMRATVERNPPLLPCASLPESQLTKAFVESPSGTTLAIPIWTGAFVKSLLITYEPHVPGSTPARDPDSGH